MELELFTKARRERYTIGKLFIDKLPFCDTLEPPIREMKDLNGDGDAVDPGEGKVMGNTAIGAGKYEVTLMYSKKFGRELPYLSNVSFFEGIMIHAGNSPEDTRGCILVGENKELGRVINSRAWENILMSKLKAAVERGQRIFITVHR